MYNDLYGAAPGAPGIRRYWCAPAMLERMDERAEARRPEVVLTAEQIEHVLAGFAELPAQPDAAPAVALLSGAGVRVAGLLALPA